MLIYRRFGEVEARGDFFERLALTNSSEDILLTRREPGVAGVNVH
jgi:hypothetical protein